MDSPDNPKESNLSDLLKLLTTKSDSNLFKGGEQKYTEKTERARKQKIENDNSEDDQRQKKWLLEKLVWFLRVETVAFFVLAFLQGLLPNTGWFHLERWSFNLIIIATISQITAMLMIAVKHLFPKKNGRS
ncbi:hypothetical protein FWH13_02425 [Candidatus Saccharibacteria bacterium]|nr:hypothetical protein [Candidatus Saccharibacteria bacterium]